MEVSDETAGNKEVAKQKGIKAGKENKTELIRTIQKTGGSKLGFYRLANFPKGTGPWATLIKGDRGI